VRQERPLIKREAQEIAPEDCGNSLVMPTSKSLLSTQADSHACNAGKFCPANHAGSTAAHRRTSVSNAIAIRIFVAVQMALQLTVIASNQRNVSGQLSAGPPIFGIIA
jgi:hypothetical protein